MVAHIYKHHVSLDECSFYCSCCLFRTTTKRELVRHVQYYKDKVKDRESKGVGDVDFLRAAPSPRILVADKDFKQLRREESESVWSGRAHKTRSASNVSRTGLMMMLPALAETAPKLPMSSLPELDFDDDYNLLDDIL